MSTTLEERLQTLRAQLTEQQVDLERIAFERVQDALRIVQLTYERDDARASLRDLVDSTSWSGEHCVIDQSPVVGSGGALDRAVAKLAEWERMEAT